VGLTLNLEMGLTCRGTCLGHLDRVGRRLGILLGHSHPQLVPIAPHDVSSPTNKYIAIKTQKNRKSCRSWTDDIFNLLGNIFDSEIEFRYSD
jgi:hypothetical protein